MGIGGAWAGARRHLAARPWTVKVYVASAVASPILAPTPEVSLDRGGGALLHLLLVLGVWAGSRFAWALQLGLLSVTFLFGLVASAGGASLIFAGLLAVWIGLLVAAPTQQWVDRGGSHRGSGRSFETGRRVGRFIRSNWRARPMTLRIYVFATLAGLVVSTLVDPDGLAFPGILLTLLSLVFVRMLWNGSAGVWWLSVIAYGAAAAAALTSAFANPRAWVQFAISAAILMLLVHGSTRRWFDRRIAERFP